MKSIKELLEDWVKTLPKNIQDKIRNADPKTKIELNKQLQALRQQMNKMKQQQSQELQKKQAELAKANTAV